MDGGDGPSLYAPWNMEACAVTLPSPSQKFNVQTFDVQAGSHIKAHLALRQPTAFQAGIPNLTEALPFSRLELKSSRPPDSSMAHSHVSCLQDCDLREILVGILTVVRMR